MNKYDIKNILRGRMKMLRLLKKEDFNFVKRLLPRMTDEIFIEDIKQSRNYIILDEDSNDCGLLLTTLLWENLPFVQHLIIDEEKRGRGYGTGALKAYEEIVEKQGYKMILLSTQANEKAQFLYRRLGYKDCGALFFENTPFDQPTEIFLKKRLGD